MAGGKPRPKVVTARTAAAARKAASAPKSGSKSSKSGSANPKSSKSPKSTSKKTRPVVKSRTSNTGPRSRPKTGAASAGRRYRRTFRLPVGRSALRIRAFMVVLALLVTVCVGRAFQLQAVDAQAFANEAAAKMESTRELPPVRGSITDRNGVVLAETDPAVWISVDPDMVMTNGADKRYPMSERKREEAAAAPQAVAEILSKHLGRPVDYYLEIVTREDSMYESVQRRVPAAVYTAIQADMRAGFDGEGARPWYGVRADPDPIRNYPNRALGGNVVGFVNHEGDGQAGIEGAFNEELTGLPGQEVYDSSTYGRIPLGTNVMTPAEDGLNYELTFDADLQWMAELALAEGVRNAGASTGMAVVLDVNNFEILALANNPTYDPARPGDVDDPGDLSNRAVSDQYEPGSVQKVLTLAALADAGMVTPDTHVNVPGRIPSGGGHVRDSWAHGDLKMTARGIMAQSSNVGTILLARQMAKGDLAGYLEAFGLGSRPGTGLPAEATGQIPGENMADYTRDQISFGQGLSVTAVQMAAAVAAATNGGVYQEPTIIREITDAEGNPVELPERESHRVISEEASEMTRNMMEAVITQVGNGREIPGYRTIGKSGTAQRFNADCSCYKGFTASFVGVAPAEDPQILVYVVLDEPTNGNLGSTLALPVVNNILQMALPRYNVTPSTTEALREPLTFE